MKLFFRDLTEKDIPAILNISKDIWEGDDYIPDVIERWLKEDGNLAYGAFLEEEMKELIGLGRVKLFSNGVAWLEGVRVKITHQKQGIGRDLMKYAIDYAIQAGAKVAQYDTSSRNLGSISLAKYHGFKEKKRMEILECKIGELKLKKSDFSQIRKITNEEAKCIYKKMDIGPGDELNIGWSYIPILYLEHKDSLWLTNSEAILQKIDIKSRAQPEKPRENEIWIIFYGDPLAACKLISYTLNFEIDKNKIDLVDLYCKAEAVKYVKELGFKDATWEDEPVAVVLYEKILN
ncbi:MAG: GNAT family N-acetyltransferase [Candidatus Lokiarchaeota archaeon]|nr:GNAT family N-acetyltransferase [Candidatus Lokiarchaeota archaeon]